MLIERLGNFSEPVFSSVPKELRKFNFAKILVVEDVASIARLYQSMAGSEHEVQIAYTSTDARQRLEKEKFDLVLTDGLKGEWKEIQRVAAAQETRTVIVSATNYADEAKKVGADFISKRDEDNWERISALFKSL